ncbi:MAG: hypothetical protein V1722_04525 [Candidatus Micrarchaeota archaeon]
MLKGVAKDAVYYALIIIFLGATLYFMSPALFKQAPPTPSNPVMINRADFATVNLTILTSSKCKVQCDSVKVEEVVKSFLVNVNTKTLNVETPEGAAFAEKFNITLVPAYVMDKSLLNNSRYSEFARYVNNVSDGFVVGTLETASGYLFNAAPVENDLKLFVTAYDANSILLQNKTYNVLKRFNNSLNFTMHYVINKDENGSLSSKNGAMELVEAAIQLCAFENRSQYSLEAVMCRSRDITTCRNAGSIAFCAQFWETCTDTWNINSTLITTCGKTQNATLFQREMEATKQFNVLAVPTMVIGGRYKIVGNELSEQELFSTVCGVYPSLKACTLSVSR